MEREAVAGSLDPMVSALSCRPGASEAAVAAAAATDSKRS
jgi:hypothetical protein